MKCFGVPYTFGHIVYIVICGHGVKTVGVLRCVFVFVFPDQMQVFFFTSLHLLSLSFSVSVFQPRGRTGGRVCCFSTGGGAEEDSDTWSCPVRHSLTLPHTHRRSDTHPAT